MAAAESLEKPGSEAARRAEPALPVEPAGVQSLHAQGEPGKTLGLSLRTGNAQLPGEVDRSTAVAAPALVSETRRDVDQAHGRHSELLSTKVRFGVVEAVNGNIRMLINRGRGYHAGAKRSLLLQ